MCFISLRNLALSCVVLLGCISDANAAQISWSPSENLYQGSTVETFISNNGSTVLAANVTAAGASSAYDVDVNGVSFERWDPATVYTLGGVSIEVTGGAPFANSTAYGDGEFSGNSSIFYLLTSAGFAIGDIQFSGLTNGQAYEIQIVTNDARFSRHSDFQVGFSDGLTSGPIGISQLNNSPTDGSAPVFPETLAGDSIIGTFIADASTQGFEVWGSNDGFTTFSQGGSRSQINAIRLAEVTLVPEPSTYALLAGCLSLTAAARRRRQTL